MSQSSTIVNDYVPKDFVHRIDDVYFPIDPSWTKISISVSGGADSAFLSYLICSTIVELNLKIDIHIISNVRMWETRPWQKYNSIDVYNWLTKRFTSLQFYRHENFIAPEIEYGVTGPIMKNRYGDLKAGDQISTMSFAEYVCLSNNINIWFGGITKNPPKDFSKMGMPDRNLDKLENINSIITEYKNLWICHPFKFTTKDWVIKQYIKYEILDLLNLTRSCEGDKISAPEVFNNLDFYSYTPGMVVPECGKCFWCNERNWAKEMNNL